MRTTVLNPFSVSLQKNPFMEMRSEPIYTNGDYKIYKHYDRHFVYTFKNIVISERGGINKEMVNNLASNTRPNDEVKLYFEYDRAKAAMLEGIQAAKELNFEVR
jgi:hypothetical protein